MLRYPVACLLIIMSVVATDAQVRFTDGMWVEGGIDTATRALACFGPTSDTRYVAITFRDSLVLSPLLTLRARGMSDVAIAVVDRKWRLLGYDHVGGPGVDSVVAMTTAPNGDGVAVIAACGGTVVPTTCRVGGTTTSGRGGFDVVTTRWKPDGTPRWARLDGGSAADVPSAVAAAGGGILVCGTYVGSTRFDTIVRRDEAITSMFVTRFTESGNVSWVASTMSIDDDADIPRGAAVGGSAIAMIDNVVTATAAGAGVVGIDGMLTRDVNTDFETFPYVMTIDTAGRPLSWQRIAACRGDSVVHTPIGSTLVSGLIEPRFCQPGTEPAFRILLGGQRLSYVPGGLNSNVAAAATTSGGAIVMAGRFERTMLFDSLSRRPDIVAASTSLQDGWIAVLSPDGSLLAAAALQAETWGQVTSVDTRRSAMMVAAVSRGSVLAIEPPLGYADRVGCAILLAESTATSASDQTPMPAETDDLLGIWTLEGRYVGTDVRPLAPGIYAGRRANTAPFPILVGMRGQ
ncbi:MAG: hypothetical protein FGM24_04575 [Candidatus Kapabacteria bacterium]|nr:hypothetical protein [Candidatus Kapabacteria bacterium]